MLAAVTAGLPGSARPPHLRRRRRQLLQGETGVRQPRLRVGWRVDHSTLCFCILLQVFKISLDFMSFLSQKMMTKLSRRVRAAGRRRGGDSWVRLQLRLCLPAGRQPRHQVLLQGNTNQYRWPGCGWAAKNDKMNQQSHIEQ